jgi:DivIVA domain-containing protein
VGTVIGYIVALAVVGGLLFLVASYTFGRGEEIAPVLPEGTPVQLPDGRLADGDDLRALRLSVALRGYRMDEVDWLLDRLSEQVDTRDREIARLRSVLHVEPVPDQDEPELLTHPFPRVVDSPVDEHTSFPDGASFPDEEPYGPGRTGNGSRPAGDDRYADGERTGPRPVPEELSGDTGARPDRPARQIRRHEPE